MYLPSVAVIVSRRIIKPHLAEAANICLPFQPSKSTGFLLVNQK
jgi:hypothetical protein